MSEPRPYFGGGGIVAGEQTLVEGDGYKIISRDLVHPMTDLGKRLLLPGSGFQGFASAQGTDERADVIYQTLDGADLNKMWAEFQRIIQMRNAQRDRLINYLTYGVSEPIVQVRYPQGDNFELASEYGEPVGIRLPPAFNMGFDFQWYDLAIRYTWQFILEASQAQVEALHNDALEADDRLLFNKTFKTLFNSLDLASSIRNIPVTVYKFWNADGIVPPYYKTYVHDGTHNHYITSGAASLATAGLQAIETHLYHHGYSLINGYKLVLILNRQEGVLLRAARVVNGWEYDFIPSNMVGGGVILPASMGIVGAPTGGDGTGIPAMIGTYGPFYVIEEDYIPAGYVVALASQGADNLDNPIGVREHANPSGRGLKLIGGDDNYPLIDSFYRHGFGTGILQRGGGVVMQVTTAGAYTIPTIYT
jgi:hypothetical protein